MTPSPDSSSPGKCERRGEALAWLQGELSPDRAADYGLHLESCAPCAEFVDDAREMLERLHDEAVAERGGGGGGRGNVLHSMARALSDVERRILQRCAPDLGALQAQARRRARRGAFAAAAILLMTVSAHLTLRVLRSTDDAPVAALVAESGASGALAAVAPPDAATLAVASGASADWIADRLGPDGRFDAASWSAPRAEEVAMHGFALLALARADGTPDDDGSRDADVLRGARWLLEQQGADGTIGANADGGSFDHAVATVALLEAAACTHDAVVATGAERAVDRLVSGQLADGGWQPHAQSHGSNPVGTAWALEALLRAEQLDVCGLQGPIGRAQARLADELGDQSAPEALNLAAVSRIALGSPADAADGGRIGLPDAGRASPEQLACAGRALGDLYAASVVVLAALPTPR